MCGAHRQRDSAPRRECSRDCGFARRAGANEVIKNAISDRFIKRALVAIRSEIKLQRFGFDTKLVWHVIDFDPGKISLAGDWAE